MLLLSFAEIQKFHNFFFLRTCLMLWDDFLVFKADKFTFSEHLATTFWNIHLHLHLDLSNVEMLSFWKNYYLELKNNTHCNLVR